MLKALSYLLHVAQQHCERAWSKALFDTTERHSVSCMLRRLFSFRQGWRKARLRRGPHVKKVTILRCLHMGPLDSEHSASLAQVLSGRSGPPAAVQIMQAVHVHRVLHSGCCDIWGKSFL